MGEAGGAQIEPRAEAAQTTDHAGTRRRLGQRLDPLHQRVAGLDIDARGTIGGAVPAGLVHVLFLTAPSFGYGA